MKLLMVGPSKTGKSVLCSFLAGVLDAPLAAGDPLPTVGCRILEVNTQGVAVELWDVSGDQSYENTWPAIQQGVDGVILCYSPETSGHAVRCCCTGGLSTASLSWPSRTPPPVLLLAACPFVHASAPLFFPPHPSNANLTNFLPLPLQKELELFYEWFCVKRGVPPDKCACFALSLSGSGGTVVSPAAIGGIQPETFLLKADGGEGVRRAFERFVVRLARGVR